MREIKTRKQSKGIKALKSTVNTGDRMKRAYLQTKERVSRATVNDTEGPAEYADDQLQAGFEEIGHKAGHLTASGSIATFRKGREAVQNRRIRTKDSPAPNLTVDAPSTPGRGQSSPPAEGSRRPKTRDRQPQGQTNEPIATTAQHPKTIDRQPKEHPISLNPSGTEVIEKPSSERGRLFAMHRAERKWLEEHTQELQPRAMGTKTASERAHLSTSSPLQLSPHSSRPLAGGQRTRTKTAQEAKKGIKTTARSAGKRTVKTAQRAIKSQKTAIKSTRTTAKVTVKTAKKAEQAAKTSYRVAQKAAKAAATTAKATAKAVAASVKAILAALQSLVTAIAAGGSVALIAIVIICLVGLLVASCFGIFFSGEDSGTGMSMPSVVREINDE